ncbi:MAG TPA: hypothetical protein PKE29_04260 [Phycisphaerales bacterium]|nr:hypothetical protein [Phycisphaerales bacterium]
MADKSPAHRPTNDPAPGAQRPASPGSPFVGLLIDHAFPLVLSLALVLIGAAVLRGPNQSVTADILQGVGVLGIIIVLCVAPVTWHLRRQAAQSGAASRRIDAMIDQLRRLADSTMVSDDARRVLNRGAERDMLCRAIEEDIHAQAWDAALVLCDELAQRFGYRADAEEFRARIEFARSEIQERKVSDAIARLDGLIVQRRWDVAANEARRIQRLFPDATRVERLRDRVESARAVYKTDLERRFLDSAQHGRVEDAMTQLKELDAYLTEGEAEPLREVARGVISKARDNLGAQFKIAVQDKQWATAAALGRRIVNEFPNTRMAQEVRGLLDGILARANQSPEAVAASN